jgi:hypothetical protein
MPCNRSVREEPRDFLYLCREQRPSTMASGVLFVRSSEADARLAGAFEFSVWFNRSTDQGVEVASIKTLDGYLSESLYGDRLTAGLFSGFTLIALVDRRCRAVRRAVRHGCPADAGDRPAGGAGADAWRIVRFVAGPAALLTIAGLVLGSVRAFLLLINAQQPPFGLDLRTR